MHAEWRPSRHNWTNRPARERSDLRATAAAPDIADNHSDNEEHDADDGKPKESLNDKTQEGKSEPDNEKENNKTDHDGDRTLPLA